MAKINLGDQKVTTYGSLPALDEKAPHFELLKADLSTATLEDYKGKRLIMNIFPSIDTGVCATSVRNFNQRATDLKNTVVLCVSRDLPFAQKRFVDDEGLDNVVNLSDFRDRNFGKDYGVEMIDGPMEGLLSRAVLVLDENGHVVYSQQVEDIGQEPDYLSALKTLL
ncbi:MAG: thiol peroxidase [Bacteroidota bacterium]|uniref:Thiol peroxidase n=1 Tax=Christiangramia flava JLT2011 TaxID=1229726 RepID=A0A1L7I038_9FLAO|nr:thiol peroxidase [Christiangramia flava]APU66957.1 Thiol peroxidase, Tpx-type [Christiangramia flava JLT2011]MEE2772901.1 thiol peroxidase [Bacteroidota bacterium]OSS38629.1 Thiol peroxidase, Tpx-type [Christiangramia flava JLT2011]